ncbi:serine/threonine kinase [Holotrichia oblita]|uniref:Serine/threonine kinase n=1 Tax=Holotrichia oblita TaxID=644536 RepID=A0ACB9TAC8_HOLOL|nr:serine/threonine kinase [Holotrichia oblita]
MSKDLDITASEQLRLASRGYKILTRLGQGTYATVYLVEYKNSPDSKEIKLACKAMDVSRMAREFVLKFLPRELDILSKISHPHIIQIQNIFQRKTKYYVFMRYAEKGDLLEFVLRRGALSEPQARVWFRQIALAIQYLHEMNIAHRDLKCENIFITANYNIRLADFGFARYAVNQQGKQITSETFCGSISYAAPEILRGLPYYPKNSDVWSLGVILYVVLNRAMPFDDGNLRRLYDQQIAKKWRFRPKVVNVLSPECKALVVHLLEPDIIKRWDIHKVVGSDWIAMDERLKTLSEPEEHALAQAIAIRKKWEAAKSPSQAPIKTEGTLVADMVKSTVSTSPVPSQVWSVKTADSVHDIKVSEPETNIIGSCNGLQHEAINKAVP